MRILLCHNNFTIHGGAEVFVHEVARVLEQNGHSVAYLASDDAAAETPWKKYFPKSIDYTSNKARAIAQFPRLVYSLRSKAAAKKIVADFQPDLVHCFAIYTKLTPAILDVFESKKIPVVCSFNDYKHICPNYKLYHHGKVCEDCQGKHFVYAIRNRCAHDSLLYSAANAIESYVHRFMDIYRKNVRTFLFASEFMARKTEEFWGAETFRWRILRNPFDSSQFKAADEAGSYALFFGRLIDEKGIDMLLRAAVIASDIPVIIVGDGPDRTRLGEMARDLGCANVEFVGEKWGADLDSILLNCRFVVVPSLWHENFPYVVLQSFAMGKPVIGSNRGGIPELVEHGSRGYIYDADNPRDLAKRMQELSNDTASILRMGENAKSYVDTEFSDARFYGTLMEIYAEASV
jgi:glycosyltransferase involved in cell wall biosynthesis